MVREILEQIPGFNVYAGNEQQLSEAVRLGAAGTIVGMANICLELILSLYAFGKDGTKPDGNKKIAAIRGAISNYPFIPAIKNYLEKKEGSAWHTLRPPLMPLEAEQKESLYKKLSQILSI